MLNKNEFLESVSSTRISTKEMQDSFLTAQESEPNCSYRAIWAAVITQALMDAGSNSKKLEMRRQKAHAISWLNGGCDDFLEVCELAGLDSEYVKKKAKEAIKNGCKWRAEAKPFLEEMEFKSLDTKEFLSIKILKAS